MREKGPGEGYMAAKDDALALDSSLVCRRHIANTGAGTTPIRGWVIWRGEKPIASAAVARDAWANAIDWLRRNPSPAIPDKQVGMEPLKAAE